MPFAKFALIKRWLLRAGLIFVFLTGIFWGIAQFWMPSLIKKEILSYGQAIGYEIDYQDLKISPLRLRLEVSRLHLAKRNGEKLLELKDAIFDLKWSRLVAGEIGFDEITLNQPKLLLERRAVNGQSNNQKIAWNWQEFIEAIDKYNSSEDVGGPQNSPKISVDQFKVVDATLELSDASNQLKEALKPFSIELLEVANYDKNGVVNGVRGQYDLNLGALEILVPGVGKRISFNHVLMSGSLDNPEIDVLGVQLNLKLDGGSIQSHWDIHSKFKTIDGKVRVEHLPLQAFIPLIPANKDLLSQGGEMNAEVMIKVSAQGQLVSGELHLVDLSILEAGEKEPLLNAKNIDLNQFEYKSSPQSGRALLIDQVMVSEPSLRFDIDEKGFSNFRRLFSKDSAISASSDAAHKTLKNEVQTPFQFEVHTVKLREGNVHFSDFVMRPNFKVDIRRFNGTFLGIGNTPNQMASMEFDGVIAQTGSMRGKGQAAFNDPRRNNDLSMNFKNLPLTAFNPPVMTFAGYQIAAGRLSLNLNYRTKDGEITGNNQIIIKNVELGDEVPNFQGNKLPLGLAIALLEDSDNTIDVAIQIAGNVDAPDFSATGLVWQALSNVFANVTTAPFRVLASILGMSGDGGISAVPGEVAFLPEDQDRMEKYGDYLSNRPNATLDVVGTYDPILDKQELARAMADAAIFNDADIKLLPGEALDLPNLSDPKIASALKAAYAQYVGRIKLGQRLLTLPDNQARNEQLRSELIASMVITENDLHTLGVNRAKLAKDLLVKNHPSLDSRIQVVETKTVKAEKEGIPLEVDLRIK